MPGFDPDKFLQETAIPSQKPFDPDEFLAATAPPENPHDVIPFVKNVGSNIGGMIANVGSGALNAALHPVDTAKNIGNSIAGADGEGLYRAIRNIPIAGPAIDSAVGSAHALSGLFQGGTEAGQKALETHENEQSALDQKHAEEHPLTDFIQKALPKLALPEGAIPKLATMALDAFSSSMNQGNDPLTAMKDARNTALLMGTMIGVGKGTSFVGNAYRQGVGPAISEEIQQASPSPGPAAPSMRPIPGFYTPPKVPIDIEQASPSPAAPMPPPPIAAQVPSDTFAQLGKGMGTFIGAHALGGFGAIAGQKVGEMAGKLVDTYGKEAVQSVVDAGINLDKLGNSSFVGPLMQAAQKGPKDLAVTHYMFSQQDPNYQKAMTP